MKKIYILSSLFFVLIFCNCTDKNNTDKYQNKGNNIINVKDKVQEIQIDDVLIGSTARLFLIDNYLIIGDYQTDDMQVHLFDRRNYKYISSAIQKGQGPGEVTNMGHIGINENNKEFYVSDHGKLKIFSYPLDSILHNAYYQPEVKKEINNIQFPSDYEFINDTLCYARIIEPTGNAGYNEFAAKWNMQTREVSKMKYTHPKVEKSRISLAVSMDNETLVECYHNLDLMTIMDLDGNLKYNVYGQNWNNRDANQLYHFGKAFFRGDKIIASYSGGDMRSEDRFPDKFFIFDLNGDYIKTLKIGYRISDFCYDEENDRIIMNFDDIIQFAYLELNGLMN